jgi:hypothetical protein
MGIRDGDGSDPGWRQFGSGIRDKPPGSATLNFVCISHAAISEEGSDPQHWFGYILERENKVLILK